MQETDIAQIADELALSGAAVRQLYEGRRAGDLRRHPGGTDWCAIEILGHLIEAEGEVFGALIPGMLERKALSDWKRPPSMVRDDCDGDAAAMLDRFEMLRTSGVKLARSLRPEDLTVTSPHNWHKGPTETVGDLLRHWPEHTEAHLEQARTALTEANR